MYPSLRKMSPILLKFTVRTLKLFFVVYLLKETVHSLPKLKKLLVSCLAKDDLKANVVCKSLTHP